MTPGDPAVDAEADLNRRHAEKMAKRKAARDRMLAGKTRAGGLLMVHTGKGKGKSTAAMGLALRALGNDMRVCIVQFVKGVWDTGERRMLATFGDRCVMRAMGEGFTWDTQDRARDIAAARAAWDFAKDALNDPSYGLVVLDELNIVLRYDYLDAAAVAAALKARRPGLHVVVTGRNAPQSILDAADMVTEMTQARHHFRAGFRAQPGIEF